MRTILIVLIVFLFFLGIDVYVFQAIKFVSSSLSLVTKRIIYSAYWLLSIFAFVGLIIYVSGEAYRYSPAVRTLFAGLVMTTYFSKLFIVLFLFIDDFQRLFRWGVQKVSLIADDKPVSAGEPISRSGFLVKAGLIVSAIPFLSMTAGILHGVHDYRIRKVKLALKNLPGSFIGKTIAQISDIHAGSFYSRSGVKKGVQMLMDEKPDMVFFTGDLVNQQADEVYDFIDVFKEIKAPLGVYSILGNHDYGDYVRHWEAKDRKENRIKMIKAHKAMGWDLLLNENRTISIGKDEIALIGVENWGRGERWPKYGDLGKAYKGTENKAVKLLLTHDPSHWDAIVKKDFQDIDATFSGHTHGFQFGIRTEQTQWSPVQYVYDKWAGLYKEKEQQLYVNVGFGFIGFPGRVGMNPEITIFELSKV